MNRDQKAAVIEEVAREIDASEAIIAVDYRGISVKQSAELRARLDETGASFRVVKNRLSARAADQAGAESLKDLLEGPTALTFVRGDAALAAKELAAFRREYGLLAFKGGTLDGDVLSVEDVEAISRLPARDVLYGQLVGVTASPLSGLVRGLGGLLSGLASQLGQIRDQGLVGGSDDAPTEGAGDPEAAVGESEASGGDTPADEAPGDPVAEAATAEGEASADPPTGDDGAASSEGADGEPT